MEFHTRCRQTCGFASLFLNGAEEYAVVECSSVIHTLPPTTHLPTTAHKRTLCKHVSGGHFKVAQLQSSILLTPPCHLCGYFQEAGAAVRCPHSNHVQLGGRQHHNQRGRLYVNASHSSIVSPIRCMKQRNKYHLCLNPPPALSVFAVTLIHGQTSFTSQLTASRACSIS